MSTAVAPTSYELLLERTIPWPRQRVFRAWTDERQLAQWFGPQGFSCPRCLLDPRPGGGINIEMRAPDGTVQHVHGVVREIQAPQRLVLNTLIPDVKRPPVLEMLHTVTFVEAPGGTLLIWRSQPRQAKLAAAAMLDGHEEGCRQTLDRLALYLARVPR